MNSTTPIDLRVRGLPCPLQLHVHGSQDQHVSRRIREDGIWEPYETSLLLRFLHPGDVFVDVGANIGYFSVLAASVVGEQGAVFAFEPDPNNYRLLCANAELNGFAGNIVAVEAALSDTAGEGRLFLSEDNLGDHQVYVGDEDRNSVPIVLQRGSDYLARRIEQLDLLKIDTQGSEFQVIEGLMPLLVGLESKPRIIVELTPHSLRQAGASGRALMELLGTLDQPFWIIDHIEHCLIASSSEELAVWCDNWDKIEEARGFVNILVGVLD